MATAADPSTANQGGEPLPRPVSPLLEKGSSHDVSRDFRVSNVPTPPLLAPAALGDKGGAVAEQLVYNHAGDGGRGGGRRLGSGHIG